MKYEKNGNFNMNAVKPRNIKAIIDSWPSNPSFIFEALIMVVMNRIPNIQFRAGIGKRFGTKFVTNNRSAAAISWNINLIIGDRSKESSIKPIITNKDPAIIAPMILSKYPDMIIPMNNPKNIPTPPRIGMCSLCIFLESASAKSRTLNLEDNFSRKKRMNNVIKKSMKI